MRIKSNLYSIVVLLTLSNSFERTSCSRARFSKRVTTMERLKKEKMRSKCAYTRNRNKPMMVMEVGLSSRMQVMETLNLFTDAYDGVLRVYEDLDTYYETVKDSGNLRALSNEMEAIEEDFNEVEGIVKGYLSGASRSSVRDQTETSVRDQVEAKRLREEVSKREEELSQIGQEIEKAYADCKRQLTESLRSEKPLAKPDPMAGKTLPNEVRGQEQETEMEVGRITGNPKSKERKGNKILAFKSSLLYLCLLILRALWPLLKTQSG